jgi:hypothetical protein
MFVCVFVLCVCHVQHRYSYQKVEGSIPECSSFAFSFRFIISPSFQSSGPVYQVEPLDTSDIINLKVMPPREGQMDHTKYENENQGSNPVPTLDACLL